MHYIEKKVSEIVQIKNNTGRVEEEKKKKLIINCKVLKYIL